MSWRSTSGRCSRSERWTDGRAAATTPVVRKRRAKADEGVVTVGRSRAGTFAANATGVIFSIVMLFPVYWVLNTAFKPANEVLSLTPTFWPNDPTLDNFLSAIKAKYFLQDMLNGVVITLFAVAGALVVGFLAALAIARFRFYGRKAVILVVLAVQLVPFLSLLIPLFLMLQSANLTNSLLGVSITYLVLILPYTVWTLRGFISAIPRELDEAALIDGCTVPRCSGGSFCRSPVPVWLRPASSGSFRRGMSSSSSTRSTVRRSRT